jgi:MFS family permease
MGLSTRYKTIELSPHSVERKTVGKVFVRIIPLLFALQFFNYFDRVNVGFAALQMNQDLGFSGSVYGFAASIFFVGYMVLQVPSSLMLWHIGPRIWIGLIVIAWGLVATSTAFTYNAHSFYLLRFMLGLAEGGFLPGIVFYVGCWFPGRYRARANNGWVTASLIAPIVGSPISTALMTYFDGVFGFRGWRWMFVVEGMPTVLLGILVLLYLTNRPSQALWLDRESRDWLLTTMENELFSRPIDQKGRFQLALRERRVWKLGSLFACVLVGLYGLILWLPQIVRSLGKLSLMQVGFLTAIPFVFGAGNSVLMSWNSDRIRERRLHLIGLYALGGAGLLATAFSSTPAVAYLLLCLASFGIFAATPIFWTIVSTSVGPAAPVEIALINTIAQIGGLLGPWVIGAVQDATHSFKIAFMALACFQLVAAGIALTLEGDRKFSTGEALNQ